MPHRALDSSTARPASRGTLTIVIKRYSKTWWTTMALTSMVIGISAFLLLGNLTDWQTLKLMIAVGLLVFSGDLIMAFTMEAVAPTKVHIGPGEKLLVTDRPSEAAIVVSGFEDSTRGQVAIRGETWQAVRADGDTGKLLAGTSVSVVDRDGLTLVVASTAD